MDEQKAYLDSSVKNGCMTMFVLRRCEKNLLQEMHLKQGNNDDGGREGGNIQWCHYREKMPRICQVFKSL